MFKYLKIESVLTLEKILIAGGAVLGLLFGGWSQLLTILIVTQGLDIATGLLVGLKNQDVSSTVMRQGLIKKVGVWILIIFSHMVDLLLFNGNMVAQSGALFAFIAQEGLSLTENLGNIGVIVPKSFSKYLAKVKDMGDGNGAE